MPTVMSHAAIPIALGLGLGRGRVPVSLIGAGVVASMLPDLDVIGFRLGIAYESVFGHRGASHALATAAVVALMSALVWRRSAVSPGRIMLFMFVVAGSHGLLDTLTNGGHGVALLWPASDERFFASFQPIEVSPIGVRRFMSARGLSVLASEAVWIWLPCVLVAAALRIGLKRRDTSPEA